MASRIIRKLSDVVTTLVSKPTPSTPGFEPVWAIVTATASGPPKTVSLRILGSATALPGYRYLHSYSPTVNDVVLCHLHGSDLIVIDKLA